MPEPHLASRRRPSTGSSTRWRRVMAAAASTTSTAPPSTNAAHGGPGSRPGRARLTLDLRVGRRLRRGGLRLGGARCVDQQQQEECDGAEDEHLDQAAPAAHSHCATRDRLRRQGEQDGKHDHDHDQREQHDAHPRRTVQGAGVVLHVERRLLGGERDECEQAEGCDHDSCAPDLSRTRAHPRNRSSGCVALRLAGLGLVGRGGRLVAVEAVPGRDGDVGDHDLDLRHGVRVRSASGSASCR